MVKAWDKRVLELLNRSESDPVFCQFLDDLRSLNSPVVFQPEQPDSQYQFPEMGVSLCTIDKMIWSATFFFNSYVNDMPFNLPQKAGRDDVHKILGPPSQVNDKVPLPFTDRYESECYELEDFSIICWYLSASDKLCEMIVYRQESPESLKDKPPHP